MLCLSGLNYILVGCPCQYEGGCPALDFKKENRLKILTNYGKSTLEYKCYRVKYGHGIITHVNAQRFRIVFLDSDLSFDGGLLIIYNGSRTECLLSTEYSYHRHCKLRVKVTYVNPLRNIRLAANKSLLLTVSR